MPQSPIHQQLCEATRDVHARLHLHDGFAAVKNGTIDLKSYGRLLARIYGFYGPYEQSAAIGHDRSGWLRRDLLALGLDVQRLSALPVCPIIPRLDTDHRRLGSLYVVEGSAFGGLDLERSLDSLLGSDTIAGRRFFKGRGVHTGPAWRVYLEKVATASAERHAAAAIIAAATETFAAFETWLRDWNSLPDGRLLQTDQC